MKLRNYQQFAVDSVFKYFQEGGNGNPCIVMPTGCHAKGQGILMYDGSVKKVEDIIVGDLLMGPDSTPRTVLHLCRGRQEMRRIVPSKGKPWVVNKDHILSLYRSCQKSSASGYHGTAIINQSVSEFESSSNWHQHIHKLYKVGVSFPEELSPLPVDPYFLGVFLGDGNYTHSQVNVTSMDREVLDYCEKIFHNNGDFVRYHSNGSKADCIFATTRVVNRTRRTKTAHLLDALGLRGKDSYTKFIPKEYLVASRINRLELLAGLIDTDGYTYRSCVEYVTVSSVLANDVEFLARSLGYFANSTQNKRGHFRITISGNLEEIPVKLLAKKVAPRLQKKNPLILGFKIEQLPEDYYYGFQLDKDHLYLLDDFTVTHNTGKSLVIASLIQQAMHTYPATRVLKLTHSKTLIEQNLEKLLTIWPAAPAGIYSAGLRKKEIGFPITFGGIGTVAKADLESFGHIDLVIIDECHLLSPKEDSMYQKVIQGLKKRNPYLKVIGLTATHYRLGQGLLTEGGTFTDICVDMSSLDSFNWFLDEGYLVRLIPKRTKVELDVAGVHMAAGDFKQNELQLAVDKDEVTEAACLEMLEYGQDRKRWLVFASGVEHAVNVATKLNSFGIKTTVVHSKMPQKEQDGNLADFLAGEYRAIVNNGILTTGFDCPAIDLIGVLRPTTSPGLWVQILGRGTRPDYEPGYDLGDREGRLAAIVNSAKPDCLVMDFAGNTRRLGPINDPVIPKRRGEKRGGTAPVKECPVCQTWNHASVRFCVSCGAEFPRITKIEHHAGTGELIATNNIQAETFKVDKVIYSIHSKQDRPNSIRADYYCGLQRFTSYICLEHGGFAGKKARDFWREAAVSRSGLPSSTAEAMSKLDQLATPVEISVWIKPKYSEILSYRYKEQDHE